VQSGNPHQKIEERLCIYVVSKKDGAMALAEIWTFDSVPVRPSFDDNQSSNSSSKRGSFQVSPLPNT